FKLGMPVLAQPVVKAPDLLLARGTGIGDPIEDQPRAARLRSQPGGPRADQPERYERNKEHVLHVGLTWQKMIVCSGEEYRDSIRLSNRYVRSFNTKCFERHRARDWPALSLGRAPS